MRVLTVDPALGGGFAQVALEFSTKLWILDCRTDYDFNSTEEQLMAIETMVATWRPSILIIEFDSQQKGLGNDDRLREMGNRYGFTIRPHTTRGEKMDPVFGVASMDQSFKKADIRIPYKDQRTQDRVAPLLNQLRRWRPDIKTKNLTQDLVMALWFGWKYWMSLNKAHHEPPPPAYRPSWIFQESRVRV